MSKPHCVGNAAPYTMNIDPKDQEVKDQPADAVAPVEQATEIEQAPEVTGQAAENAEEVTEG